MKDVNRDGIITVTELSKRRADADRKRRFTKGVSSHTAKEEAVGFFMG